MQGSRLFAYVAHPPFRLVWMVLVLLVIANQVAGAGRELAITPGTDYYGHDYATLKEIELEECQAACVEDLRCEAFTFNLKSGWCFLKDSFGDRRPFSGAVSGHILQGRMSPANLAATRGSELRFLPPRELEAARALAERIARMRVPADTLSSLVEEAKSAAASGKAAHAADLFAAALRLDPADQALWVRLAEVALAAGSADRRTQRRLRGDATAAAINAYLRSERAQERAQVLDLLARTLSQRQAWREAIRAARASLQLIESPQVRAAYDRLVAEHGFRVTGHQVDSDAASPRICIQFSGPLARTHPDLSDFVRVADRTDLPVETEERQICVEDVRHGESYRLLVRAGLPSADGETLARSSDLDIYVRDRSPAVRFLGRAYVLPKGDGAAIPLASVNTDQVEAAVYRIGDRALTWAMKDGVFPKQLGKWDIRRIADSRGESIWKGVIEVRPRLNREVTTSVPVGALVPEIEPGVYAMTARAQQALKDPDNLATQWFLVSDLGLATFSGQDGLHVLVRSLSTAAPVADLSLRLVAANNEILGRGTTDAQGYARFDPGLLRGAGGNAPALLTAEDPGGDYVFLDLTQSPFDLADRGVEGRPPPKPLDVYLVSERGAYRPGERVRLTALVRDAMANAVTDLPLTLIVKRPDGVEHLRLLTRDQGEGGHEAEVILGRTAMRGTWRASVHSDPQGPALADLAFLVEDFEPERLNFDLASPARPLDPADPPEVGLEARYLYGAPAAGLKVEGDIRLRPTDGLAAYPGYRFGLESESFEPVGGPLPATATDAAGRARVRLDVPRVGPTSKVLEASLQIRLLDEGGRPVERSRRLPLASKAARIGVKPLFEGSVDEGGNARFHVIALGADGRRIELQGLRWTLSRLQTSFQWYESDGTWDYEPITSSQRVAAGTLDAGSLDPGRIESPVEWGAYRLAVEGPDAGVLPVDLEFEAGWYLKPKVQDTPDLLKVSLDKSAYRIGERVVARIEPRFSGLALVMVIDDRLIEMRAIEVPEEGATLELPVTAAWGPGAYVTAVLYRPMDLAARRMPARAIGLTWAEVDPGERRLAVSLGRPPASEAGSVGPRQTIEIPVSVDNLPPGETAYATLAAVDLGILNLTRYQPPAPDDWYFRQRRLGMEVRDLYGRLIDRMQGVPGVVRSGGDGIQLRMEGPPPTEDLVAFHSGIVKLDATGKARISIPIPDFNGTLRLMAMAWSATGVGHGVEDLLVRDPVVVSAVLPPFLSPGDRSRLLVELAHVEGPAGELELSLASSGGHTRMRAADARHALTLTAGGRARVEVPIEAVTVGDDRLAIRLRTADGHELRKTLRLPVRSNAPPTSHARILDLAPGAELRLDAGLLADRLPGTGSLLLSIGGAGRLDVAGLLLALDRYPYGCTEQLTSRALPLLYLDDVAQSVGLGDAAGLGERVRTTIAEILANQASHGGFGLWGSAAGGDTWLDAYVTDFLTRAREQDYQVPDVAFHMALENLRNRLAYAPDFSSGGEWVAYALYVLARNGRASISDLRYYADTKLDAFSTALAKAQLGAGLALYGDRPRADRLLGAALEMLASREDQASWRADFGSQLRDGAALLTLAAETGAGSLDLQALAGRLQDDWSRAGATSTQDDAWLLLAAHALMQGADQPALLIGGEPSRGGIYRRWDAAALAAHPFVVENGDTRPLESLVRITGVPRIPAPAGGNGYRIERAYYDLKGRRVQPSAVIQGARMVAVVTVRAETQRQARLIVNDPLPAGFEIDNPHLVAAGDIEQIPWLGLETAAAHTEFRSDRFVAAIERGLKSGRDFQLAYRLRAVSPGIFAHPAATVEDMYRPDQRAWTATGRVEVLRPPTP